MATICKQFLDDEYIITYKSHTRWDPCQFLFSISFRIKEMLNNDRYVWISSPIIYSYQVSERHALFHISSSWWCHQMETLSKLLAPRAGNSQVTGEFLAQRPVTRSVDVFFDLGLNERLSKQSWGWWLAMYNWQILSCHRYKCKCLSSSSGEST